MHCFHENFETFEKKKQFPNKKITRSSKAGKPWLTPEILEMVKQKHALYAKFVKSRDPALLKQFKKYRNSVTNQLRAAKDAYFMGMFSDPANQTSEVIWRKLNALLKPTSNSAIPDVLYHNGQKLSANAIPYAFNEIFSLKPSSSDHHAVNSYIQFLPANSFNNALFLALLAL